MKKKNKTSNIIMVIAIIAIVVCGVMMIGNLKGWFNKSEYADNAVIESTIGSVNIERNGVAYSADKSTQLRDGDIVETKANSKATVKASKNTFVLSEKSEIKITSADNNGYGFEILSGEVFCVVNKADGFSGIVISGADVSASEAVFSADILTGSANVNIFDGEVTFGDKTAQTGNVIQMVVDSFFVGELQPNSLNEFNIEQAMNTNSDRELCFDNETLQGVIDARTEEIRLANEEQAKADAAIIAQGGTEAQVTTTTSGSTSGESGNSNVKTCTIQIRCDTILDNMDNLTEGKNAYVPSNGIILATSTVQFVEGETAFDVLKRACEYAGIQLEYSWTPLYNSYYVEGINHLYEFDCGSESGWMYKVNGWFPNYGSSSYEMENGDVMVWCYTCNGLGADVGGNVY